VSGENFREGIGNHDSPFSRGKKEESWGAHREETAMPETPEQTKRTTDIFK